ncbi:MAG: radical SAM protein, partial [Nanoarchaeota archaeon]
MRVIIINPPYLEIYGAYKEAAKLGAQPQMPLGICHIATILDKMGHEVKAIDSDVEGYTMDGLIHEIGRFKADLVGISSSTPTFPVTRNLVKYIKKHHPQVKIFLGGPHVTVLPEQAIEQSRADFGLYYEAEDTLSELMAELSKEGNDFSQIKGLVYIDKEGKVVKNERREQLADLDSLPMTNRRFVDIDKYVWSIPGRGFVKVTSLVTQRGCPFKCTFCCVPGMYTGARFRSLNLVMEELEDVVNVLGIKHIYIQDDTLTLNKKKVEEMCHEIIRRGLDFTWEGYTRANLVDKELLTLMKKAGMIRLSFGLETGNQHILNAIKKGTKLEDYEKAYDWCDELGIETRASVMIGHPFETRETVKKTVAFLKKLKVYQAYINISTPYPGSELYEQAKAGYGGLKLLTDDWEEYQRYGNAVVEVNDLKREDL